MSGNTGSSDPLAPVREHLEEQLQKCRIQLHGDENDSDELKERIEELGDVMDENLEDDGLDPEEARARGEQAIRLEIDSVTHALARLAVGDRQPAIDHFELALDALTSSQQLFLRLGRKISLARAQDAELRTAKYQRFLELLRQP